MRRMQTFNESYLLYHMRLEKYVRLIFRTLGKAYAPTGTN